MNYVARRGGSAVRVLIETGCRHMSIVAPANSRRIEGRTVETGCHRMSRIAPGSRHRLMKALHSLLAH